MPTEKTPYKYRGDGPGVKGTQMPEEQAERARRVVAYAAQHAANKDVEDKALTYFPRPDEGQPGRTRPPRRHDG